MSLANKYRPKDFSDVVGQDFIVRVLMRALDKKEIPHSLLFAGPRGVGKTTVARIFAKGLNCEVGPTSKPCGKCKFCLEFEKGTGVDVVEIDAASNRGIENIREIQNQLKYLPLSRYKVYIVDEAHMLTNEAFNSLLKVLEEPPSYVVFILATTEPQKIPPTVMSRLQKFSFKPHSVSSIVNRLKYVCSKEGIYATEEALRMIAQRAEGSLRDALVLLEQLSLFSDKNITEKEVSQMLGMIPYEKYEEILEYIVKGDFKTTMDKVNALLEEFSPQEFASGFIGFLEDRLLKKDQNLSFEEKTMLLRMALDMEYHTRDTFSPRSWITYDIARMCSFKKVVNIDEITRRFGVIDKKTNEIVDKTDPMDILRVRKPSLAAYLENCKYSVENGIMKIVSPDGITKLRIEESRDVLKEVFGVDDIEIEVARSQEKKFKDIFEEIKRDWERI